MDAPTGKKVTCANNASYVVKGMGDVMLSCVDGNYMHVSDVLYVPGIKKNLLSISMFALRGFDVSFQDDRCIVQRKEYGNTLMLTGSMQGGALCT